MNRLKIFVSAYACEPGLGSEIGVGWHWVLEMSKYFDLWVLTRKSNQHSIEPWIADHPQYANIHFLYFDLPKWARFWKKGLRGVRIYYNIWQMCTNRIVKRTMQENDIKIFHHLTYGNAMWRVSSYGKKQFFVWGPIGGLESIPEEYSRHYGRKARLIEKIRRMAVDSSINNHGFKSRCESADLILCKTDITRSKIPQQYSSKAVLFTDVAADVATIADNKKKNKDITEFITVGRLDAWRGFDLVIEAFASAVRDNQNIHLTIVGDGSDRQRLKSLVEKLNLDNVVTLLGKVPMEVYKDMMNKADVVVNAALKEGAVTVSFDCMAMGKPLICLDTTGYTRYFNDDYAVVIPRAGREEVIDNIKKAVLQLTDYEIRDSLGSNAKEAALSFSWERHGVEIRDAILKACSGNKTEFFK